MTCSALQHKRDALLQLERLLITINNIITCVRNVDIDKSFRATNNQARNDYYLIDIAQDVAASNNNVNDTLLSATMLTRRDGTYLFEYVDEYGRQRTLDVGGVVHDSSKT